MFFYWVQWVHAVCYDRFTHIRLQNVSKQVTTTVQHT